MLFRSERFNVGKVANEQSSAVSPTRQKPDLKAVKTLANIPAADIEHPGGDADEFAHLDRLNGLELEKAVSRMSEAERERYRAAA